MSTTGPDVQVEIAFNSDYSTLLADRIWTDVSGYVEFQDGIAITGGRADERSTTDANSLALTLDNTDGRFTPELASGAYYPNVQVGRPIRVITRYPSDTVGNMLSAVDASVESSVGTWAGNTLLGLYPTVPSSVTQSATRAWVGSNSVRIAWAATAGGSLAGVWCSEIVVGRTYTVSAYVWVPAGDADVRIEAAFLTASAYTSTKGAWTRLSTTFTPTTFGDVFVGIQANAPSAGDLVFVDGIMVNEGTTAATFTTDPPAERTRFQGYIESWNTEWPGSVDGYAVARVSAASQLATIGNNTSLRSLPVTEIMADDPLLYYTLGEEEGTRVVYSVAPSTVALQSRGHARHVVFGVAGGARTDGGTAAEFSFNQKYLQSTEDVATIPSAWTFEAVFSSIGSCYTRLVYVQNTATAGDYCYLEVNAFGAVVAKFYDASAIQQIYVEAVPTGVDLYDGEPHHVSAVKSGGTITAYVDGVAIGSNTNGSATWSANTHSLAVGQVYSGTGPVRLSHVALFGSALTAAQILDHAQATLTGYDTDTADERLLRLAGYAGIEQVAMSATTEPIAHIDLTGESVVDVMRKIEATEGGVLFDARGGALTYTARTARYSASSVVTLSFLAHEVEGAALTYDKTGLVNEATANYVGGSIYLTDQASRDAYGTQSVTLDLATELEAVAYSRASWEVGLFATPRTRSAALGVIDLTQIDTSKIGGVLSCDVGSLITVSNWPTQAPGSSLQFFVEGYSEQIELESHRIVFNVSPATVWLSTFMVGDATRGKLNDTYYLAG